MTDVNIAVEMISDAFNDNYDTALLITADSDLLPALKLIKGTYPDKRIIVGFPPARHSFALQKFADGYLSIFERTIAKCLFPEVVIRKDGYRLLRPVEWH